jgi:hypothetical protein
MNDTTTLADRVRETLLSAGFNGTDGGLTGIRFRITEGVGVNVGTEARGEVPESVRRAMLGRYAARLREAGMLVSDRTEQGHLYVHEGDRAASLRAAITEAEASLSALGDASREAYRHYREIDARQTARADEIREMRRELRDLEARS